ncbi:hypothetical protein Tco_0863957 [Tanacetum coccineum]
MVKADAVRSERKKGKKFLIKTLGQDVVEKVYKDKVKYDKYCLKMLNKRAQGKITNYDVLTKGKEMMDACPKRTEAGWNIIYTQIRQKLDEIHKTKAGLEQDPITNLNQLATRKRKSADNLHDYFKSTKSIEYFEELYNDMPYNVQEIFFRLHQGSGIDDLVRTFSSFLVAEVDKRHMNPLKQMRLIEQLRQ